METSTNFVLPLLSSITLIALVAYAHSAISWKARSRGLSLPPGPKPLPLIGNIIDLSRPKIWIAFQDFNAKYGEIAHYRFLGQSTVILGSASVLFECLEKHSANTSDRKQTVLLELSGHSINPAWFPYGQWWRRHRRIFWEVFNPRSVTQFQPVQRMMTHKFLLHLLRDPLRFEDHIRSTFSAMLLKSLYDIDAADDENNPYITMVNEALEGAAQGLSPGKFLVGYLPFLRHVPAWFPGAGFQKQFAKWRGACLSLKNEPFAHLAKMSKGPNGPADCVANRMLARADVTESSMEEEEDIVKNVCTVAFEGGADTTFSTFQSTFLALSLYPDVLKKAQAELDTVVGPNRLPDFGDMESLVYMQALIKEALRWQQVAPFSLPHCTTADDEFRGYFIPQGTLLLANVWSCMHDPDVYENPEEFRPDRFIKDGKLDPTVRDPYAFVFGFGRRICPGRHFAEASLFINLASVVHVFDVLPPLDSHGCPIEIKPEMSNGLLSYPEDCRCTIKPRSAAAEALILAHN